MKKIIFSVAIVAAGIALSASKVKAQKGFMVGVEGTPQISWLLNSDDRANSKVEYKSTFNGSFGLSSHYGFTNDAGIGLNVLYSFQGQNYSLSGVERNYRLEYFKVPIMFTYNYELMTDINFIGRIGPQLDMLSRAKITDVNNNDVISDYTKAYEITGLSGVVTAGIMSKITDQFFWDVSIRYDYGFTDAEDKDYKVTNGNGNGNGHSISINSTRAKTYNSTLGLNVGLRYLLPE